MDAPTTYDVILGLIPLLVLGVGGGLIAAGLSTILAVGVASAASMSLIGYAVFVAPPVPDPCA